MTLQTFHVFGRVTVNQETITVQYKTFQGQPTNITGEEISPSLPAGLSGEFLFGLVVNQNNYVLSVYETKSIDEIELTSLPVVKKYMDLIADSVRMLDKLKA